MKMFFSAGEDGRVISCGSAPTTRYYIEVELDANAEELLAPMSYRIQDGKLVKDDELHKQIIEEEQNIENERKQKKRQKIFEDASFAEALKMFAQNLPEEKALIIADVYPEWKEDTAYTAGEIVRYGTNEYDESQLYTVIKTHVSTEETNPNEYQDFFKKLGYSKEGTAVWIRPLGEHDVYERGDVVWHNGKKWESAAEDNKKEPGVADWTEVEE